MAVAQVDTLPVRYREKAKKELHEDEKQLNAHLESFQRWIDSLPHITYPRDYKLLLPFLRQAKYHHDKAQARLDNFCTLRASELNGMPHWFEYPPVNDPIVDTYLKTGTTIELGRTKDDVLMILTRFSAWDMDVLPQNLFRPLMYMDVDRQVCDPLTQVAGYGIVFDMTGCTTRHLMMQGDKKELKMSIKMWQDGYPFRVKHLIFYNEPVIMDAIFKLVGVWLSDRIKPRLLRVKGKIQKAYDKIPGLKDIMPVEYGGKNGTMNDLIEKHAKRFRDFYSKPYPWTGIRVDESKRPDFAKSYMRQYKDVNVGIFGTEGTYIQLDPGD